MFRHKGKLVCFVAKRNQYVLSQREISMVSHKQKINALCNTEKISTLCQYGYTGCGVLSVWQPPAQK